MLFSKKHLWVDVDGDIAQIGITDYAQNKLGNILFINMPDVGDEISTDVAFGDIESVKTVSDLFSPVAGKVIAVNEELIDEPDKINEDAYNSWFIKVAVSTVSGELLNKDEYERYIDTL